MHTIMRENDKGEYLVGYLQVCEGSNGQSFIPLFHGLGCVSAIKLASSLNGGDCEFDSLYAKVLPSLAVK